MLDSSFNCVHVFSYQGKRIRSWGTYGNKSGEFKNPWGITICRDIVFVVDSGNRRIQAFTLQGEYIFEYSRKDFFDIGEIIIINTFAYVNDWKNCNIAKLKLIYD